MLFRNKNNFFFSAYDTLNMYIKFKKTRKISNQFFDVTYNSISVKKMRQNKKVERIAATTTENRNERLRLCFYDNHPSSCMVTAWNRNGGGGAWQKIVQCNNIPQKILGSAFLIQCIGSSGRRRVYIVELLIFQFLCLKNILVDAYQLLCQSGGRGVGLQNPILFISSAEFL